MSDSEESCGFCNSIVGYKDVLKLPTPNYADLRFAMFVKVKSAFAITKSIRVQCRSSLKPSTTSKTIKHNTMIQKERTHLFMICMILKPINTV